MNKDKILTAIKTCATMENYWNNGSTPSSSYIPYVVEMREILESLLTVNCKCNEKK